MAPYKRKREILEDMDEDEPSFGRQILPVANLPDEFDGIPADGMQYLFTVRRDARQLPHTTRAANPYERPESPQPSPQNAVTSHNALPPKEWRTIFARRFKNFRKNLTQPTIHVELLPRNEFRRLVPDKQERDSWWAFLAGKPESDWNSRKKSKQSQNFTERKRFNQGMCTFFEEPRRHMLYERQRQESWQTNDEGEVEMVLRVDPTESLPTPSGSPIPETSEDSNRPGPSSVTLDILESTPLKAREPRPALLRQIDERMALHLLMYFTHWMNLHIQQPNILSYRPTETHARWIFVLLSKVNDYISADDMSLLRNLARACLALLKTTLHARALPVSVEEPAGAGPLMSDRSCWIVISTIVDVWGQHDLWKEAEDMLVAFETCHANPIGGHRTPGSESSSVSSLPAQPQHLC